ncbi:hypothetical protein AB5J55_00645 [Streptomyces sp. R11]|uniref:Uncharacterized protein n=1 Tax=Streptomyces sp. R11 TaxID=3238625 RepID=A0AB39MPI5_9ACTN
MVDDRVVGAASFDVSGAKVVSLRGIVAADKPTRLSETWRQPEPGAPVINTW